MKDFFLNILCYSGCPFVALLFTKKQRYICGGSGGFFWSVCFGAIVWLCIIILGVIWAIWAMY